MLERPNVFGRVDSENSTNNQSEFSGSLFNEEVFILMNKDIEVLKFKTSLTGFKVIQVYDKDKVPFMCKRDLDLFNAWLRDRPIATNQEHLKAVLDSVGLDNRSVINLLKVNNGFSLNDCFWIKQLKSDDTHLDDVNWEDNNLYENEFDEALGLVTFFGNKSSLGGTLRSPEVTNQGSVGKAWRRINGELVLYKKDSEGAANSGKERFAEVIASNILNVLGLNHVTYTTGSWHSKKCSCCGIFTDIDKGYLPMYQYLSGVGYSDRAKWTYDNLIKLFENPSDKEWFDNMIIFDYIIENWDRHYSNFGFLIDNSNQEVLHMGPVFDNGYSLMARDMEYDFKERNYFEYSVQSKTFAGLTNRDAFFSVVLANPILRLQCKEWGKLIKTNIDDILNIRAPKWYLAGVRDLLLNRSSVLINIDKFGL